MSAHLRFLCPTCNAVMEAPIERAGKKIHCLKCGQRIQIPPPQHAKTIMVPILGVVEDRQAGSPASDLGIAETPSAEFLPSSSSSNQGPSDVAPVDVPMGIIEPGFYYLKEGQSVGPLSLEQMQERIASRQLLAEDLAWREGMPQWVVAREISELFPKTPVAATLAQAPGAEIAVAQFVAMPVPTPMEEGEPGGAASAGGPKRMDVAIILASLLGPLGMLYSTIGGAITMSFVTLLAIFYAGWWLLLISWPAGIYWAAIASANHNNRLRTGPTATDQFPRTGP